jgi:hypothetical protein
VTHLCELDVVVVELLLHDLLQDLEREDLGLLQRHRLWGSSTTGKSIVSQVVSSKCPI